MEENIIEGKTADNRVNRVDNTIREIKVADKNLESSYDALKSIDEMEDAFTRLNKNMNRLADLLDKSVKGKKVSQHLDDIKLSSQKIYKSSIYDLDVRRKNTKQQIEEFESIKEEYKRKLKEEEAEELQKSNNDSSETPQTI